MPLKHPVTATPSLAASGPHWHLTHQLLRLRYLGKPLGCPAFSRCRSRYCSRCLPKVSGAAKAGQMHQRLRPSPALPPVRPNPSLKRSANGRPPGPPAGTVYIFCQRALASCRRRPLSSNVRQRKPPVVPVQLLRVPLTKAKAKAKTHTRDGQRMRDGRKANFRRVFAGEFRHSVRMNSVLRVGARHSHAMPVAAQSEVAFAEAAVAVPSLQFGKPAITRSSGGPSRVAPRSARLAGRHRGASQVTRGGASSGP